MNGNKRIGLLALLLSLLLASGTFSCIKENPNQPADKTSENAQSESSSETEGEFCGALSEEIILQRRELAESKMRESCGFIWKAGNSFSYPISDEDGKWIDIVEGQYYRGLPYTHAQGNLQTFSEYQTGTDENGIPIIAGLKDIMFGWSGNNARLSSDCSGTVSWAWGYVSDSIIFAETKDMTVANGYLPIGDYRIADGPHKNTKEDCEKNTKELMAKCYAMLQKADAVVNYTSSGGHVMMVSHVDVRRKADGSIDTAKSTVNVLHQTSSYLYKKQTYEDSTLGTVNICCGVDDVKTFDELFKSGYLPITCEEFQNPDAVYSEPTFRDSLKEWDYNSLFTGVITTAGTEVAYGDMVITDENGKEVRTLRCYHARHDGHRYPLRRFSEDGERVSGDADLSTLPAGNYHCCLTVLLMNGRSMTVRDFDFTKK